LLACSLVLRRRAMIAANTAVAVFFALTMLGFNIPFAGRANSAMPRVRIMTYNIHHVSHGAARIARDIREVRPDIVCLQETNPAKPGKDVIGKLRHLFPDWHCATHGQLTVLSRYPIAECEIHPEPVDYWRVLLEVTVLPEGRRLTVINLHMNTAADSESLTDHYGGFPSYLRSSTIARSMQVSRLLGVARGIRGPLVLAGDFNTPPRGRLYRRLTQEFQDCFRASGWGFGYSFRSDLPVMRIDYVLVGNGLRPARCIAPSLAGSDHRPVVADVVFTQ
jgi:vancomycin resistance protein VanJ